MKEILKPLSNLPYKLLFVLICFSIVLLSTIGAIAPKENKKLCESLTESWRSHVFSNVYNSVQAKAWYLYDATSNSKIYSRAEDIALPLASLTKLMTVRTVLSTHATDGSITLTAVDLSPYGSSGFSIGDTVEKNDLIRIGLVASSNDAMYALARSTFGNIPDFLDQMNIHARTLNLSSLKFATTTGLDEEGQATAWGNAKDVSLLFAKNMIDYGTIFSVSKESSVTIKVSTKKEITLQNTNSALSKFPFLIASKTGYTLTAGGNLSIAWTDNAGGLYVGTVLGSTEDARFTDMILLQKLANIYIEGSHFLPQQCKQ